MTLEVGNNFLRTQKVLTMKEKIDKLEILKRQAIGWEKYTIHTSDQGSYVQNI